MQQRLQIIYNDYNNNNHFNNNYNNFNNEIITNSNDCKGNFEYNKLQDALISPFSLKTLYVCYRSWITFFTDMVQKTIFITFVSLLWIFNIARVLFIRMWRIIAELDDTQLCYDEWWKVQRNWYLFIIQRVIWCFLCILHKFSVKRIKRSVNDFFFFFHFALQDFSPFAKTMSLVSKLRYTEVLFWFLCLKSYP